MNMCTSYTDGNLQCKSCTNPKLMSCYTPLNQTANLSKHADIISRPSHYTDGRKYEPKDVIRDWNLNFNLGSAVKYISRAGRKDDIIQDLKKAKQFIDFEIEALTEEREQTNVN